MNEFHVRASVVETVEASTTMFGLTAKTNPISVWGDLGNESRPIIAYRAAPGNGYKRGSKDALDMRIVFDVFVESDSTGLASAIADELESIITNSNLSSTARTYPVDVAPFKRARFPTSELDEGRSRITLEYDFWHNR